MENNKSKEKTVKKIVLRAKKTGYGLVIEEDSKEKYGDNNKKNTLVNQEGDEDNSKVSEKEIIIKIEDYRNIKKKEFRFVRSGTNIIVGENDVGKTNLLDFIYYQNHKWDGIDEENHIKNKTGMACDIRVPLFFGNKYIDCRMHSKVYLSDKNALKIRYTCKFYYFDLKTITSFLEKSREETKVKKMRTHSFYLSSSKNERWSNVIQVEKTISDDYWKIDYGANEKFRIFLTEKTEEDGEKHISEEYIGRDKYAKNPYYPVKNIGSGYQKLKKFESLIDNIKKQNVFSEEEVFSSLLIIDEPEVFLHPSSVSNAANLIKSLEETTTILTTHSPAFLSHFNLTNYNETCLIILKKDEKENLKDPWYLENFLEDPKFREKIREDYKKFADLKKEKVDNKNFCDFYKNKWKRLFNQETLRIFFAKKVLFVEGMAEYILFNNILKEELYKELKGVEIIPIFGKFHYVFFYELAKWLKVDYWFLLDEDKTIKDWKGKECWREVHGNKEVNKVFWEKYGKNKVSEEKNGIIHSKKGEAKISWIRFDLEVFLRIKDDSAKDKEYNLLRRESDVIESLKDKNSAKLNELRKIFTDFLKFEEEK